VVEERSRCSGSLALVGKRKDIWPETLHQLHSLHSSFTAVPSRVSEGHDGMVLTFMY